MTEQGKAPAARTAADRENLLAAWRRLLGSDMRPIATDVAACPQCRGRFGVRQRGKDWILNDHSDWASLDVINGSRCKGSSCRILPMEVEALS